MAKKIYVGVNGKARKVKKMYVGAPTKRLTLAVWQKVILSR